MLHIEKSGPVDGALVLFLHAGGFDGFMWGPFIRKLKGIQALVPDLPGHGWSRNIPFTSLADTADIIANYITQELPGKKVHIVGLSFGAYIGFELLSHHSHLISSAALSGFHILPLQSRTSLKLMTFLTLPLAALPASKRYMLKSMNLEPTDFLDAERPTASMNTIRKTVFRVVDYKFEGSLQNLTTPLLALAGEKENDTIIKSIHKIESEMPDSTTGIITNGGHFWPAKNQDLFTQILQQWLAQNPLPNKL